MLTVDFSGGNPIPAGGLTFDGGTGGGNTLIIGDASGDDSVTMDAAQITVNGSAPIAASHAANIAFDLGGGVNNLTLDHVTYNLAQDDAISAGTKVTVDGGALNYNGHADPIGDLLIENGGQVIAPSIDNATTTVSSGTLTTGSIVCDTLTIGSFGAAAGSPQSPAAAAAPAGLQTWPPRRPCLW